MSFDNEASNRDNDAVLDKQEREERLERIAEVYPEAAEEARVAGMTNDELEAELARLRAENRELRKQRALLLESQTYWMSAAGGEC